MGQGEVFRYSFVYSFKHQMKANYPRDFLSLNIVILGLGFFFFMSSQKLQIFIGKWFSHIKENFGLDINVTLQVSERLLSFMGRGKERERELLPGVRVDL